MIAGIDPGTSGSIAILSPKGDLISIHDIPKTQHDDKTIPDAAALALILHGKTGEKDTKKKKAQIAAKALTQYPSANLYRPKGGLRDGRSPRNPLGVGI